MLSGCSAPRDRLLEAASSGASKSGLVKPAVQSLETNFGKSLEGFVHMFAGEGSPRIVCSDIILQRRVASV